MTESRLDTYSEYERSRDSSGATAQQKRTTPTAAIRFMRAFLGSVNHQARLADRISSVGISDVQEMIHDIALWSVRRRKRERGEGGRRKSVSVRRNQWMSHAKRQKGVTVGGGCVAKASKNYHKEKIKMVSIPR